MLETPELESAADVSTRRRAARNVTVPRARRPVTSMKRAIAVQTDGSFAAPQALAWTAQVVGEGF
jgi:hypothetical protein